MQLLEQGYQEGDASDMYDVLKTYLRTVVSRAQLRGIQVRTEHLPVLVEKFSREYPIEVANRTERQLAHHAELYFWQILASDSHGDLYTEQMEAMALSQTVSPREDDMFQAQLGFVLDMYLVRLRALPGISVHDRDVLTKLAQSEILQYSQYPGLYSDPNVAVPQLALRATCAVLLPQQRNRGVFVTKMASHFGRLLLLHRKEVVEAHIPEEMQNVLRLSPMQLAEGLFDWAVIQHEAGNLEGFAEDR